MVGTSMATPAVAGLVALLGQARPDLTSTQLKAVLVESAFFLPECASCGRMRHWRWRCH